MAGLIRTGTLIAALALAVASTAVAGTVWPPYCTVPRQISLMGVSGPCVPDPIGKVMFIIRDASHSLIQNVTVVIDFRACTDVTVGPGPGRTCPFILTGLTDALGRVEFTVPGFSNGLGPPRAVNLCARVHASGYFLPELSVSTFDRSGSNGVDAADLALWIEDFVNNPQAGRSDFDGDGQVGASDLTQWISVFVNGGSVSSSGPCASSCP
jgi:hypothetical protein